MGKNFQANFSLYIPESTLSKLKLLSQASNLSMAKIINNLVTDYVAKFSAEIAELKHATRTVSNKIQEKNFGENVKKVTVKKIPTNDGARLVAVLDDDDQIVAAIKVANADEEKAKDFIQKAMSTIGSNFYEIKCTEKSIAITVANETLSQKFDDAGTAEKVEAFIDEIFAQLTKQAFQNQGN